MDLEDEKKEEEHSNVIARVTSAADAYVSANPEKVENLYQGYGFVDIPVGDLRESGLLMEDIKDPETGKTIPDDAKVRVRLEQGNYMDFIFPVEDEQDAWQLYSDSLTVANDPSGGDWCSITDNVYKGLVTDISNISGESQLFLENKKTGLKLKLVRKNIMSRKQMIFGSLKKQLSIVNKG